MRDLRKSYIILILPEMVLGVLTDTIWRFFYFLLFSCIFPFCDSRWLDAKTSAHMCWRSVQRMKTLITLRTSLLQQEVKNLKFILKWIYMSSFCQIHLHIWMWESDVNIHQRINLLPMCFWILIIIFIEQCQSNYQVPFLVWKL